MVWSKHQPSVFEQLALLYLSELGSKASLYLLAQLGGLEFSRAAPGDERSGSGVKHAGIAEGRLSAFGDLHHGSRDSGRGDFAHQQTSVATRVTLQPGDDRSAVIGQHQRSVADG